MKRNRKNKKNRQNVVDENDILMQHLKIKHVVNREVYHTGSMIKINLRLAKKSGTNTGLFNDEI